MKFKSYNIFPTIFLLTAISFAATTPNINNDLIAHNEDQGNDAYSSPTYCDEVWFCNTTQMVAHMVTMSTNEDLKGIRLYNLDKMELPNYWWYVTGAGSCATHEYTIPFEFNDEQIEIETILWVYGANNCKSDCLYPALQQLGNMTYWALYSGKSTFSISVNPTNDTWATVKVTVPGYTPFDAPIEKLDLSYSKNYPTNPESCHTIDIL